MKHIHIDIFNIYGLYNLYTYFLRMIPALVKCFGSVFPCPLIQVESGWGILLHTQTSLQHLPIEFQDRGLNPGPTEPVDLKSTVVTVRPQQTGCNMLMRQSIGKIVNLIC